MSKDNYLEALYNPDHILIAGFSPDQKKAAPRFLEGLKEQGFSGTISLLGRRAGVFDGHQIYDDVDNLPSGIDMVFNMYPAEVTADILPRIAARGVPVAVVFTSGFAEQGGDAADAQSKMVAACRANGMRLVGPNCPGYFYLPNGVNLTAQQGLPKGPVALISQSGNVGITLWDQSRMLDIGWTGFIGVGNQSDIPLHDHIAYLGDDENTKVIALYIEGLPEGQGKAFKEVCQRVSRKKPIVALKGGRTNGGRRAAQSHTASLSSDAQVYSALFDECGIIEVGHLEHLLPIAEVLYRCPPLKGDRIAIVGSGGGHSTVGTDEVELVGLQVPEFNATLQEKVGERLPAYAPKRNPIDMTGGFTKDPTLFSQFTQMVIDLDGSFDGFVNYGLYGLYRGGKLDEGHVHTYESAAPFLGRIQDETGLPIIFYTPYAYQQHSSFTALRDAGIPCFADLNLVALGLGALRKRGVFLASKPAAEAVIRLNGGVKQTSKPGTEADTAQLLAGHGVKFPKTAEVGTAEEAVAAAQDIGFPVVLKAVLPGVLHKTDVGAVKTGLGDAAAVASAARDIEQSVSSKLGSGRLSGYLVAQDLGRQRELFVGVRKDHAFGSIGVLGVGGVYAEAFADTNVCLLPASPQSVELCLSKLRSNRMWGDFRGAPALDRTKIAEVLNQLASALDAQDGCTAIECNPVMAVGQDLLAVDAVIEYLEG
ncbi:acetate--CoA ligase family protein [Mesorhizobium sp. CAU 1732]|uniref:acetate--CoA ligase family protein n=1 Tax=Mesorhizobium sp. CAU 1732 TaxID=3140358 RepID=UPI0032609585